MTFADVIEAISGFTHLQRALQLCGLVQLALCAFVRVVFVKICHL